MARIRIQLCPGDQAELGVDGDLVLDLEALKDLRASELQELDRALGGPAALFLPVLEHPKLPDIAHARRVAVFLALRQAGHDVEYAKCDPRLARAVFTREVDAPVPPADGPSEAGSPDDPPASS